MNMLVKRFPRLNPLIRRFPALYQAARRQVDAFEDMDLQGRLDYQSRRLRGLLRAAGHGGAALGDLPPMRKADVRAHPERFRRHALLPESAAMTSGTNGEPLRVFRSFASVVFEQAAIDWVVARTGHDFARDRVAVLRATPFSGLARGEKAGVAVEDGRVLNLPINDLSPETFPAFMDALRALRPSILYVMPTPAEYLADLMLERGITFEVPLVFSSSEVLTDTARHKMRAAFNARCIDYYGQAERVSAAYAIEPGRYHFLGASAVTELPMEGDRREVVGTNLHNRSQLLLRYRTGDLLQDNPAEDAIPAIATGLVPFSGIRGRSGDVLVGRDGRKFNAIDHIPRSLDQYGRFQFVQERPNSVIIQMAGWSEQVKGQSDPVVRRARLMLSDDFDVEVRFVDQLEKTAAGKTPFVVRHF